MKIKILGKKTGLGNQIQMIPYIIELIKKGYDVYSDSNVYDQLGICPKSNIPCFTKIAVYGYDIKKLLPHMLFGNLYAFSYRIKGRLYRFGLNNKTEFLDNESELYFNNKNLFVDVFENQFDLTKMYHYPNNPVWKDPLKIVFAFSGKKEKRIGDIFLDEIWRYFYNKGYINSYFVDYRPYFFTGRFKETPTLKDLENALKDASYCIAADTGVAHLAQYLGIPTIVIFGPTDYRKNANNATIYTERMSCSPCYDHGRINCINKIKYNCNNIYVEDFLKFTNLYIR